MATARKLPDLANVITINASGAAQPATTIGNSDSISFHNAAPNAIKITFTNSNGTVFNDIPSIGVGQTSAAQNPQQINQTVNYSVTNLSSQGVQGPYAIEVGSGPLRVNIVNGNATPASMATVEIPQGGQVDLYCDNAYTNFGWTTANVFTPTIGSLARGSNPQTVKPGNQVNINAYTISTSLSATQGRGTVKINS
ncbi:MAG: hypothetical protein JOY93_02725 [Acidobacteriales bacterium]|nr:hypothetical protein [Terriglobales bacterium]